MDRDIVANTLGAAAMRLLELRLTKVYELASPSVGQNLVAKVPGGVIWELLDVTITLVTSAVVANRSVAIRINDGDGNRIAQYSSTANQTAGGSIIWTFAPNIGYVGTQAQFMNTLPWPGIPLQTGFQIGTSISGLDAGDQISNVVVIVREWSEADVLQEMRMIAQQMTSQVMPEIYS